MRKQRAIFHIDVNLAFLSWRSAYRLSQDPEALNLRMIPAVVGGNRESRHGIMLAKSTSVKAYDITTGEPPVRAPKKCPRLTAVSSRFDIHAKNSKKLVHLLEDYTPNIGKFSIDEALLNMTETIYLFGEPMDAARQIRERVKKELGSTVNVGAAPNKLLAKMISDFRKLDKYHSL